MAVVRASFLLMLSFAATTAAGVVRPTSSIRLGEIGAFSGPGAEQSEEAHRGVMLAVERINKAGGVNGAPIEIVSADDRSNPKIAVREATRLVNEEHVVALLGENSSSLAIPIAQAAQALRVPVISPGATHPQVTQEGDYAFRASLIDSAQGEAMARFAADQLKAKNILVIEDKASDYSEMVSSAFRDRFASLGGRTAVRHYAGNRAFPADFFDTPGTKEFDAIFMPGYFTDVGFAAKAARARGIKVPFLGTDGWASPKLFESAGDTLSGSFFTDHFAADDDAPAVRAFVERYRDRYPGETPSGIAAVNYDATLLLADALQRASSTKPEAVRKALASTRHFEAVTGPITIGSDRNPLKPAVVFRIDGKKPFVFFRRVMP